MSDIFNVNSPVSRRTVLKAASAALVASCIGNSLSGAEASTKTALGSMPAMPTDLAPLIASPKAVAFDPACVRLLPGSFLDAQTRDGKWLLSLSVDRFLHSYCVNAGLPPKDRAYGGWEMSAIAGHTGGHYLSALAAMYRATGDAEYKVRADYMVSEFARCQEHTPDGFITAMPDYKNIFAKIASNGQVTSWAPWYNVHKLFAGLRDAYRYCGNDQAKTVFLKLSDWALAVTSTLNDDQLRRMLSEEHGGMAETAADAYAMTNDKKYLELARRFTDHAIMDPLAEGRDELDGKHSNTNIPKLVGYERIYKLTGQTPYHASALFFWQTVVRNRSFANGGNGDGEHFFPVTESGNHLNSTAETETCCTYNMIKLTDELFVNDPKSEYADYTERATIDHILASQEPDHGMVCYFTPMKPGMFRIYNDPENAMWCCTGTGMENHARYGMSIYFSTPDAKTLYINQYIASTLNWSEAGINLRMDSSFPASGRATVKMTIAHPSKRVVKLRKPFWATNMSVKVNGKHIDATVGADGYIAIDRRWKSGDSIDIELPMSIRFEALPHAPNKCAIMYGPVLLASPMGREGMDTHPDIFTDGNAYAAMPALNVSALVGDRTTLAGKVLPVAGSALTFKTNGLGDPSDVTLTPFYSLHHQRYNLYWNVYSPDEWKVEKDRIEAEKKKKQELDARTIDSFIPGHQQDEVDHKLEKTNSMSGAAWGRTWRSATDGSFSFLMKVDPSVPLELSCTYWGGDSYNRIFDILIDDKVIATQKLENLSPGKFVDIAYDIPASIVAGKSQVRVAFKSAPGAVAGGVFGCLVLKKSK